MLELVKALGSCRLRQGLKRDAVLVSNICVQVVGNAAGVFCQSPPEYGKRMFNPPYWWQKRRTVANSG
jgi:hypothetical protein